MNMWEILYLQEKAKQQPDPKILTVAAFKALQSRLNLLAWTWTMAVSREDQADAAVDIEANRRFKKIF
ncbi:MAG: hypothetical protein DLM68_11635 [Hyphomicrobiales bacterium]|nr:MAG: hypothetical protein DLM68_11635 [Hyphomicrobiales bacterium]